MENLETQTVEVNSSNTPTWFESLKDAMTSLEKETNSFFIKETAAAGGRARKILQDIRELCKEGRKQIQDTRTARKVK